MPDYRFWPQKLPEIGLSQNLEESARHTISFKRNTVAIDLSFSFYSVSGSKAVGARGEINE